MNSDENFSVGSHIRFVTVNANSWYDFSNLKIELTTIYIRLELKDVFFGYLNLLKLNLLPFS